MEKSKKYTKIGAIWKNQDKETGESYSSIRLGDPNNKNEKYRFNTTVTVTDNTGRLVAEVKNGYLSLFDPKEGAPQNLLKEIIFTEKL